MEMPCMCACGEWFDLHDGRRVKNSNTLVCDACGDRYDLIEELENKIEDLQLQIDNGEIGKREGKKQLKALQKQLNEATA